tara:strand:+ start:11011 stop:12252 length:1242 start_codon:yes stop_codon:yes gene_type:complete
MLIYNNNEPYVEGLAIKDIISSYATPAYVYSQEKIKNNYLELSNALSSEIFYAVKANSNLAIIKLINSLGAGTDVVSIGEMKRALKAGVSPKKIIFEGVGKSNSEILFAIQNNIRLINIESIDEINRINQISKSNNIEVRIGIRFNPNIDGEMLNEISTGKKTDKFGVSIDDAPFLIDLIKKNNNLKLIGISCHIGSQIFNINIFKKIFKVMKDAAKEFNNNDIEIKHLDLGGGFGVQYQSSQPKLNLEDLSKLIVSFFHDMPYSISFEPGRYIVANAGILITEIITKKSNGGVNYLITDAGMNTLIRPSLYGANHEIDALNKSSKKNIRYTIAGPICESTDIFTKNIELPEQEVGDFLIIKDVGAYGAVMASDYNSRGLPNEILVNGSSLAAIHQSEKIDDIIDKDIIPSWL